MSPPTEAYIVLLRAVIDRIIPRDQDPGASDLGTDTYIVAQLSGDAASLAATIWHGLERLDELAIGQHKKSFAELESKSQDALLAALSHEPWFKALAELTAEGFYADPGYGGNAGPRSWTMIGYDPRLPG